MAWRSWLPAPGTEQEPPEQERNLPFPPTIGCLLSIGIGLLGVGVFYLLVTMAVQGEIRVGRGEFGETRVWLIREAGELGLGLSRARVVSGTVAAGAVCVETQVSFFMLRAAERPQPVSYCECLEKVGENWTSTGECPAQPSSTY